MKNPATSNSDAVRAGTLAPRVDHQLEALRAVGPQERRPLVLGDPLDSDPYWSAGWWNQDLVHDRLPQPPLVQAVDRREAHVFLEHDRQDVTVHHIEVAVVSAARLGKPLPVQRQ